MIFEVILTLPQLFSPDHPTTVFHAERGLIDCEATPLGAPNMPFSTIPDVIDDLKAGKMIILTDDEDRENEGDLVCLASTVTPEQINFMLKEGRGVMCLALAAEICDRLQLDLQSRGQGDSFGTAFTVSIDAAEGITTGVSANDRTTTIRAAIAPDAEPADLVRPGHLFPLRARRGGCLVRPGQTEGSVNLARLAGEPHAAVIIEIMNDDGTMARVPDLTKFIKKHDIRMASIADLIEYRRKHERLVERVASTRLPTRHGKFSLHLYNSPFDTNGHLLLLKGITLPDDDGPAPAIDEPIMGRVHSECLTGDALSSTRCDCGDQLDRALANIASEERGFLLYMRQEGRGIGLMNKLKAYALQDAGLDTVEANLHLGFSADERNYGTGAQIIHDAGIREIRLLTNNPRKRKGLVGYGLNIVEQVPLLIEPTEANARYLRTKRDKLGHLLSDDVSSESEDS